MEANTIKILDEFSFDSIELDISDIKDKIQKQDLLYKEIQNVSDAIEKDAQFLLKILTLIL